MVPYLSRLNKLPLSFNPLTPTKNLLSKENYLLVTNLEITVIKLPLMIDSIITKKLTNVIKIILIYIMIKSKLLKDLNTLKLIIITQY
mmetsp:Transcript_10213/g.1590  ORF Transcript_10213/g.1590 Transcript_10213/m.1590 type:complete len:88 (-) Transcript_10213:876-1139(-)